jgi:hypothetical protein
MRIFVSATVKRAWLLQAGHKWTHVSNYPRNGKTNGR